MKFNISALFLISLFNLLVLVLEATSSSKYEDKLWNYQSIQQQNPPFNFHRNLLSIGAASNITRIGRVFYPIGYGADPTGVEDSTEAIMKAVEDAFHVHNNGLELLPGINDLGGVVIDFQGGNYKISQPIRLPSGGGNVVVKGGTLRASHTFPGNRYLIELWSPSSVPIDTDSPHDFSGDSVGIFYEDITFRDILFDSSYRGGGIFIIDSVRIRINNCFFLHFSTKGILVQKGHETFISNCFLGQYSTIGGDKGEKYFTGVGIDIESNDNAITDVAIFSAEVGIILRGQANMVTGVHCYNKATGFGGIGILVKVAWISQTRIDNCYMDYTSIVIEDPVQVHVTNGFFLGDGNIVLKAVKGHIHGVNIVNNMFNGNPQYHTPIVRVDGSFWSIEQVVIERNNAVGMDLKSTVGTAVIKGNGTMWVADFSPILLFPDRIRHIQYSLFVDGLPKFTSHAITNVSNNVVLVETDKIVSGKVFMTVQQ
ncbi:polygalacturonase QRT3 [Cannabis sativa]|uniref:Polygalacturonase QRT3 n=1 Tax=Cannabis sativa TaxID=3483 RepID=A0A803QHF1_CANSA|nr:polygalacturonase QRT3 [Cannabis sativa]